MWSAFDSVAAKRLWLRLRVLAGSGRCLSIVGERTELTDGNVPETSLADGLLMYEPFDGLMVVVEVGSGIMLFCGVLPLALVGRFQAF